MLSKEQEEVLGEYFSNFFTVKCNVMIDFNKISEFDTWERLGTFFHEYMHFIQNASTTYGNMNMTYFYARTLNRLHVIYSSESNTVDRIIKDNVGIDNAGIICDLTLGDNDAWTYETYDFIFIENVKFVRDESFGPEYDSATVPIISLKLIRDRKVTIKEFRFGAMAIMESMASLFEKKCIRFQQHSKFSMIFANYYGTILYLNIQTEKTLFF